MCNFFKNSVLLTCRYNKCNKVSVVVIYAPIMTTYAQSSGFIMRDEQAVFLLGSTFKYDKLVV